MAIVATGGLSHQVHGERAGFNNPEWDHQFLDADHRRPDRAHRADSRRVRRLGGFEGAEVIMWLIMRGALSDKVRQVHSTYYLPSMTGIATLIYENEAAELHDAEAVNDRHRARMAGSGGVEELAGTYPFDIARSVKGYRLNKFLHDLVDPGAPRAVPRDPERAFEEAGLTDEENAIWSGAGTGRGMIHYGVIFFMLEKLGAVIGVSNLHIYAAMRGQTLEEFQKTRNTQVLYSVAGRKE